MRRVLENWNGGLSIGGYKLSNLRYADDTTLVATSALELEELLLIVKAKSEALGLRLNVSKTKIMIVGSDWNEDPIVVDGTEVEHVTQFNFLGSLITTSSGCSTELRRRMAMAKSAMAGLNKIWTDRGITKAMKKRLVSALIFPIATYGCESWTLTKADQSRITTFEMWCWRRMLRISWFMKRSNISVLEEIQPKRRLLSYVQSQMMKYFGHIARRGGDSLEKVIIQGCVEGRRKPGRPRARWIDQIKSMVGCPLHEFTTLSRIVRGGVMLLQSRAVSHDRIVPTDRPNPKAHWPPYSAAALSRSSGSAILTQSLTCTQTSCCYLYLVE